MYKKIEKKSYGVWRYVADTVEDAQKIPVDAKSANMGSECYVIATGKDYILGSGSTWYSKAGDDEKIECNCKDFVQESTIWESINFSK